MRVLTFTYSGVCGLMTVPEVLTSGMVGKKVSFAFTSEWDGLTKTAVYQAGDILRAEPCEAGENEIPADVLAIPGKRLLVGIYGENAEGTLVTPTIYANGPVIQTGADPLQAPVGPQPVSAYERLQAQIGDLTKLQTTANGNLVEAINEAAKTGSSPDNAQSGSGVWVGPTPPEDTSLLWVDTSDNTEDEDPNDQYCTEEEVAELINTALGVIENGSY